LEALKEGLAEIANLVEIKILLDLTAERFLGTSKLAVAAPKLLKTFDIRRELIRRLDESMLVGRRIGLDQRAVILSELLGKLCDETLVGNALDLAIGIANFGVIVLDRRGKVTRKYLGRLVIERHRCHSVGIERTAELSVLDERERVRNLCDLRTVLGNILVGHRFHQAPTANELHSRHIGKKVVH